MQFTRLLKKIKIYALFALTISLIFSYISSKDLLSNKDKKNLDSSLNEKIRDNNNKINPKKILLSSSHNNQKDNNKNKESSKSKKINEYSFKESPILNDEDENIKNKYNKYLAIKLILDLGKFIIRNHTNHENIILYAKCIGSIKNNLTIFEPHLKNLWNELYKLHKNEEAEELKNKYVFINIFNKLNEKTIKLNYPYKSQKKCRAVLNLNPKILRKSITSVLTREEYFGALASMKQQPFIDSMFSVHRNLLPSNAFEVLNRSSKGLASFKINSQGLTDIAVPSLDDIKKARNAKKSGPQFEVEQNYFGKMMQQRFFNNTMNNKINNNRKNNSSLITKNQKIHVILNNSNIDFPGQPNDNLDDVEVSGNFNLTQQPKKNLIINRKIIYPKAMENQVNNQLKKSNLLTKINGNIINSVQKANGDEEIFVHANRQQDEALKNEQNKKKENFLNNLENQNADENENDNENNEESKRFNNNINNNFVTVNNNFKYNDIPNDNDDNSNAEEGDGDH